MDRLCSPGSTMAFAQQDVACLALSWPSWGFGRLARSSGSLECPRSPCWRTYNLASLKIGSPPTALTVSAANVGRWERTPLTQLCCLTNPRAQARLSQARRRCRSGYCFRGKGSMHGGQPSCGYGASSSHQPGVGLFCGTMYNPTPPPTPPPKKGWSLMCACVFSDQAFTDLPSNTHL